ncbi:mercury(II) reductase [Pontibacter virosus]|uniref:Mercuric reductase n=1 Tax=Pontibacter virosus TaxID=1765052 RepID=A0A2U1AR81_9BACT|nr:mercury(II) reductase [Pontibacter virosus]PVY38934.1 mercuric reductase [Pontibacter virosus]
MKRQFDLIIIGGGSAAFAAAIKANELQLSTLMVNGGLPLGGTCVNVGCVPSKFLIRAAESVRHAMHSPFDGVQPKGAEIAFKSIIQQKKALVSEMQSRKYLSLLADLQNVTVLEGNAQFVDKNTITVKGEVYEGIKIVIATGSTTALPSIEGLSNVPYLTSDTLFDVEEQPESLIVIGGGYIGLEIAQLYNRLGTKVTVVMSYDRVLVKEGHDITDELTKHLTDEGIEIKTGAAIKRVWQENSIVNAELEYNGQVHHLEASHVVIATGRRANTENLGLEKAGVVTGRKGHVVVNEYLETNVPNIYAIGDVNTLPQFVYTAAYEGTTAVGNAFQGAKIEVDYNVLPWVVFTDPQVAGVGMDERQAEERGIPYEATVMPLSEVPRSIAALDTRGFIKLIRNTETDHLLGARIVAPEGSELTMELSLAIKYNITVKELASALHPYLTLAEGVKLAAMSFTKDVKKMSCCAG